MSFSKITKSDWFYCDANSYGGYYGDPDIMILPDEVASQEELDEEDVSQAWVFRASELLFRHFVNPQNIYFGFFLQEFDDRTDEMADKAVEGVKKGVSSLWNYASGYASQMFTEEDLPSEAMVVGK